MCYLCTTAGGWGHDDPGRGPLAPESWDRCLCFAGPYPAPDWKLHVPVINMREPMVAVWVEMGTFSLMAQVSPGPPEEIDSK